MTVAELTAHVRDHLHTDRSGLTAHFDGMRDADVADVLNGLSRAEAADVLELLPPPGPRLLRTSRRCGAAARWWRNSTRPAPRKSSPPCRPTSGPKPFATWAPTTGPA